MANHTTIHHDYYKILGIKKSASQSEIKRAYRTLIGIYHPDRGGGNQAQIFLLNEAYETLKDPQKRLQYDRLHAMQFGHNAHAQQLWHAFGAQAANLFKSAKNNLNHNTAIKNARSVLGSWEQFGKQFNKPEPSILTISLATALAGGRVQFSWQQQLIQTTLPKGLYQGAMVKLTINGAAVWFAIKIQSTACTYVDKRDIHHTITIYPWQAALGDDITLAMFDNLVITVPPLSNSERSLKLVGKGIDSGDKAAGDLYIYPKIELPPTDKLTVAQRAAFIALKASFEQSTPNPTSKV